MSRKLPTKEYRDRNYRRALIHHHPSSTKELFEALRAEVEEIYQKAFHALSGPAPDRAEKIYCELDHPNENLSKDQRQSYRELFRLRAIIDML